MLQRACGKIFVKLSLYFGFGFKGYENQTHEPKQPDQERAKTPCRPTNVRLIFLICRVLRSLMNTSSLRAFGRQTVIPALGIIVIVLSLIDTGYQSSVRGLDLSWDAMLGYAHAHNLQHGRDLLFNYGPLSFMESAIYFEKNHADVLLLRGLYALTLGLCFFCVLRIRRVIDLLLFCALALFLVLLHDVYLLLPALLLAHPKISPSPCAT